MTHSYNPKNTVASPRLEPLKRSVTIGAPNQPASPAPPAEAETKKPAPEDASAEGSMTGHAFVLTNRPGATGPLEEAPSDEEATADEPSPDERTGQEDVDAMLAAMASQEPEVDPVEHAREEAERILAEATRQAESISEEAYRLGFEQGQQEGKELGKQTLEPMVKNLDTIAQSLLTAHEDLITKMEGDLIQVAFVIASHLLRKELELHPETVVNVAREALKRTVTGGKILIRAHPMDIEYLQQSGSVLPEFASHSKDLTLQADYDVLRGGVLVETESGTIDASLPTQLAILSQALGSHSQDSGKSQSSETETPVHVEAPGEQGDS